MNKSSVFVSHMTLVFLCVVSPLFGRASTLGVHYSPQGWGCEFLKAQYLDDAAWNKLLETTIKPDLNHLSSINVGVIRFTIWPERCGYPYLSNGSATANFDATMKKRLNAFVSEIDLRDMKVIININPNNGLNGLSASSNPSYSKFRTQMISLLKQVYFGLKAEKNLNAVLYFDVYDEASDSQNNIWDYCNALLAAIPDPSKRGLSILHANVDFVPMKNSIPKGILRYLAYNTITDPSGVQPNQISAFNTLANDPYVYGRTIVLLGSFAYYSKYDRGINDPLHKSLLSTEVAQLNYVASTINYAETNEIPYIIHWNFVDSMPQESQIGWGLIYADPYNKTVIGLDSPLPNTAKAALGWLGTHYGPVGNNFDFEASASASGMPPNWWNGGTVVSILNIGASPLNPTYEGYNTTSNYQYGRLSVNSGSTGDVWIATQGGNVKGKKTVFVNFYYRSNLTNIVGKVQEYDSNNNLLRINISPAFTPTGWTWNNFQHNISGGWSVPILSNTNSVCLVVQGTKTSTGAIGYLDVDTVSVGAK